MILDSYSTRSSNVCNQLTQETSEESSLHKRSSPSAASFPTSVLNSPRSVDDTMMDKSSRSPSVASDLDELESSSVKCNDVARPKPSPNVNTKTLIQSENKDNETNEPEISQSQMVATMQRLESTINSLRESTASQISHLELQLTQKSRIIADLEDRLEKQRDYEEIKRELSFMRNELSHFGPIASGLETAAADPKTIESYLVEKSKALQAESLKLDTTSEANNSTQQMMQRHAFFNPFSLPQLQGLGNVESFGTLLGEEIATSYAKAIAKRDPSFLAMAAAAAVNTNNSCSSKLMSSNNATNNSNNLTDSFSPSQISNGEEAIEEKSVGSVSASTTPTSAMICPDGNDPLGHSPIGASAVPDLALSVRSFSPSGKDNLPANVSYDKLQQQLRCNVEKYMNENLNTLQISRCVREFLSMHNIGQRLFAKYVLGLSQGTVSELLSKPKPWDKLTEKGRDSYRKMHAWATDDRCITLLKSMVPRKGKEAAYKQEDPVAEERIAQILNEAQRSMKGVNRADYFSSSFLNGEHHHQAHHHLHQPPSKMEREIKRECPLNDNISENGSERDDKSDLTVGERKSPASSLNATALATINNFYRNFNDSLNFNERSRKGKSVDGDDLMQSPDLMRLYQDQLVKLIGQHIEENFRNAQNYDDVRNAVSFYNQELSRMNPFAAQAANPELFTRLFSAGLLNGAGYLGGLPLSLDTLQQGASPLEGMRKSAQLDSPQSRENREPCSGSNPMESRSKLDSMLSQLKAEPGSPSQNGSISGNNGTSNSVLSNGDLSAAEDLAASPLQRMQSITNSLLSQSSLPSLPTQSNRPAKAVLPPITQQQFDQYNNLNTEDIVKRVKEQLSQYSISQRLFGESVLGLSQGSVSDLLARPKPWHMLTQKGREPFIRMKMFLEDDNAIHKLVASQYKIAPEKLMRTGSFVAGPGLSNLPISPNMVTQIPTPPSTLPLNPTPASTKTTTLFKQSMAEPVVKYEQSLSPSSVDNGRSNASTPDSVIPPQASSPLTVRQRVTPYASLNQNLLRPALSQSTTYMQPSVYELAALTSDLDTQIITTRIKETLMAHNIGQKIFGEVVLGLSQGSVSELLSKPKPWHMLSIKGREPFIRMQLWLNDPNNIEKLQTLKNERREANKRRRTHIEEGIGFKPLDSQLFNFSNNFPMTSTLNKGLIGSPGSYSTASTPNNPQPTTKKARILFTEEQKEALRIAFAMDPYPSSTTAEFLAKELNLSIRTITNWFHNHRMRLKQINNSTNNGEESNPTGLPYSIGRDSVSFDQSHFRSLLSQRLADLKLRAATVANSNNSSNGSSNSNSNHFSSFGVGSGSSPQHRFKYSSPLFQSQSLYSNNTNSCSSPGSSSPFHEEEDIGTLDLSMSSHNQQLRHPEPDKLDSTGRSSVQDDSDDGCRSGDEEETETHSDEDEGKVSIDLSGKAFLGSSRRKPQLVMSSSSRRKAAQPQQWVAPVDPICYGEDDYVEEDSEDEPDLSEDCHTERKPMSDHRNGSSKDSDLVKRLLTEEAYLDDQKTDEEMELEPTGPDSDTDQEISVPPYKKLKSSTSVMSKLAISDDSSNIIQECVQ